MSELPQFQYSLRTLLIIMTVSAVLMGLLKSTGMLPPPFFNAAVVFLIMCLLLPVVFLGIMLFLSSVIMVGRRYAMTDPLSPRRLASFTGELQAEALVEALAAENIRAMAMGGYISGFRAEAPGEVQVVVASQDLPRAMEILEKFEADAEDAAQFGHGSAEIEE
jgi:hypothetical protein